MCRCALGLRVTIIFHHSLYLNENHCSRMFVFINVVFEFVSWFAPKCLIISLLEPQGQGLSFTDHYLFSNVWCGGWIGDVSCLFIPVNPAFVGESSPSPAYRNPPLSGCDWHKSPQGKALMDGDHSVNPEEGTSSRSADTAFSSWPQGGNWCSTCLIYYNRVFF